VLGVWVNSAITALGVWVNSAITVLGVWVNSAITVLGVGVNSAITVLGVGVNSAYLPVQHTSCHLIASKCRNLAAYPVKTSDEREESAERE